MIEEGIKFAKDFPRLLNPYQEKEKRCEKGCGKCQEKFSKPVNFDKFTEKHFDCFLQSILKRCLFDFEYQFFVKESFKDTDYAVSENNPFIVVKTNYPIDIVIKENDKRIPIEIKKFGNEYNHIGVFNPERIISNNSLITFPGEQSSIGQHFTDLIKVIRFLSITDSETGYLVHFLSNDRPSYMWDTINSFDSDGKILIFGEDKTTWHRHPIWGCMAFNKIKKDKNFIEFELTRPKFTYIEKLILNAFLEFRNRFFNIEMLLKKVNDNYEKQFNLDTKKYNITRSRESGDNTTVDIFCIKKYN